MKLIELEGAIEVALDDGMSPHYIIGALAAAVSPERRESVAQTLAAYWKEN